MILIQDVERGDCGSKYILIDFQPLPWTCLHIQYPLTCTDRMPVFPIDELDVHFPFEPYDVQKELMRRVIDCVKNVSHDDDCMTSDID